jgi:hypothetical protein
MRHAFRLLVLFLVLLLCRRPAWADATSDCNARGGSVNYCESGDGTVNQYWYPDADGDGKSASDYCCCGDLDGCGPTWDGWGFDYYRGGDSPGGSTTWEGGASDGDCDDGNAYAWSTTAAETCDGQDNDCDGSRDEFLNVNYYPDSDGDGFGDDNSSVGSCNKILYPVPVGSITTNGDCDDGQATVHPGALETCDGVDSDCNALTTGGSGKYTAYYYTYLGAEYETTYDDWTEKDALPDWRGYSNFVTDSEALRPDESDLDEDGFVVCAEVSTGFIQVGLKDNDCDDTVATIFPGAADMEPYLCTSDFDGDGYGDLSADDLGLGTSEPGTDCEDADDSVFPGSAALEMSGYCGHDADEDGYGDELDIGQDCDDSDAGVFPGSATLDDPAFCGSDADQDGYGADAEGGQDCDDVDDAVFPGSANFEADPTFCGADIDSDGYGSPSDGGADCDDRTASVYPGSNRYEPAGFCGVDRDNDEYGSESDGGQDCDDGDGAVFPGSTRLESSSICAVDSDGDEYGSVAEGGTDCDDLLAATYPGSARLEPAGFCGGDADGDEYGALVDGGQDCDDVDGSTYPGSTRNEAPDFCGADIDGDEYGSSYDDGQDCDDLDPLTYPGSTVFEDVALCVVDRDIDGWGDEVGGGRDCDDRDSELYPGSARFEPEFLCVEDVDGDEYGDDSEGGADCDDTNAATYPGSTLLEADVTLCAVDADRDEYGNVRDGGTDCDDNDSAIYPGSSALEPSVSGEAFCGADADGDGFGSVADFGTDCDDNDSAVYPGSTSLEDPQFCGLDNDGDGYGRASDGGADCDDSQASIYPGSARYEGATFCGLDNDGDGYASDSAYDIGQDCDDGDSAVQPGAVERCNGLDDSCDGALSNFESDEDGDGYVVCAYDASSWQGTGSVVAGGDCDDTVATGANAYPGAPEYCDSTDTDCDGSPATALAAEDADVLDPETFYADADGDGHGTAASTQIACVAADGYVALNKSDCDDSNKNVYPAAVENCDGVLNNCVTVGGTPSDEIDGDNDRYVECEYDGTGDWEGPTVVNVGQDCAPDDPTVYPYASELCDGITNDCGSRTDEDDPLSGLPASEDDNDGDQYVECYDGSSSWPNADTRPKEGADCADTEATVYPGAPARCDGQVNDCEALDEGLAEEERDDDGDGYVACGYFGGDWSGSSPPVPGTDCEPVDGDTFPGAPEQCDGQYNDCDARIANPTRDAPDEEQDLDGDDYVACGYNPASAVWAGGVAPSEGSDCVPYDATAFPGARELCDGQFNDCDDVSYVDGGAPGDETDDDGDAFIECEILATVNWAGDEVILAGGGLDCDDENPGAFPGCAPFDDLEGCLLDEDDDDYGDSAAADPYGVGSDCDDALASVHPSAAEICEVEDVLGWDGDVVMAAQVDNDCDGDPNTQDGFPIEEGPTRLYQDRDIDGYGNLSGITFDVCVLGDGFSVSANDCDDTDPTIHPGAMEMCNEIDEDCDLTVDEPEDLGEGSGCLDMYRDADLDGYGSVNETTCLCLTGQDTQSEYLGYTYVRDQTDCYDYDDNVYPNNGVTFTRIDPDDEDGPTLKTGVTEWLDGNDNDCDRYIPVIELDCDDDGSRPLLYDGAPTVLHTADEVGLSSCVAGSTREVACLGEESITASCDSLSGLFVVRYDVSSDGFGGRFDGGYREYPEGRACTTEGDCDDQCAARCPDQEEVCDGVDNDCSDVVTQDDVNGLPVPVLSDLQRADEGITSLSGTVSAVELDVDQDGYIGCDASFSLADGEVHYTDRSCADRLDSPEDEDCENFCGWEFPGAVERCDGFVDACDGDPEGTDDDRDAHATCGAWGPEDGALQDDIFVLVWVGDEQGGDTGAPTERSIVPLLLPRLEAPECDEQLERSLLPLVGDEAVLDAAVTAGDPTALLDLCASDAPGGCTVVRLVLDENADEQLYGPAEGGDDDGFGSEGYVGVAVDEGWMTYDCATRPEQLISRTVWNRERIVSARRTVIEWECRRLFGVACADINDETPLLSTWADAAPDPGDALVTSDQWWKEIGRYNPEAQVSTALMTCWGDPTDELVPTGTATGGDCADGHGTANRDAAEGPGDLVGLYWDDPLDCARCVDGIDNNCDGNSDCEDPSCAECFVGQGGGCGAAESPCGAAPGCAAVRPSGGLAGSFGVLAALMALSGYVRRRPNA